MEDISNYQKIREDALNYYKGIGSVFSPVLNEKVYFNAEGFNHIIFKGSHSERDKSSQILRFKLLPLAQKLIKISTTYQEFEETIKEFDGKKNKKRVKISKSVIYWGIIAIIEGRKIKTIIRKAGNGNFCFWSVIPAWTTNKYRDIRFYTTMKGNPEED